MNNEKLTADEFHKQMAASGGKARAESLSPKDRSEAARRAVQARWTKYYKAQAKKKKGRKKK